MHIMPLDDQPGAPPLPAPAIELLDLRGSAPPAGLDPDTQAVLIDGGVDLHCLESGLGALQLVVIEFALTARRARFFYRPPVKKPSRIPRQNPRLRQRDYRPIPILAAQRLRRSRATRPGAAKPRPTLARTGRRPDTGVSIRRAPGPAGAACPDNRQTAIRGQCWYRPVKRLRWYKSSTFGKPVYISPND